jgi:hypothetical protein
MSAAVCVVTVLSGNCGVLAIGRCSTCSKAFCGSHQGFDHIGRLVVDRCSECRSAEEVAKVERWAEEQVVYKAAMADALERLAALGDPQSVVVDGKRGWCYGTSIHRSNERLPDGEQKRVWSSNFVGTDGATFSVPGLPEEWGATRLPATFGARVGPIPTPLDALQAVLNQVADGRLAGTIRGRIMIGRPGADQLLELERSDSALVERILDDFEKFSQQPSKSSRFLRKMSEKYPFVREYVYSH